ncbi:hypothetical protein Poli38472_007734 [Pythium oligandrum]|uniref:PH domain-containing protein n=1 Tax=Pythium oligandrum TaxID=41045 RepID=A0A8K1CQQ4_PYTOL|nr:hypothetical protein Poli38472_007734 [Pythium oligandrum]|eukprot:TMW68062.1 hypothetical protein Poli38472_007734 [Pythium oligandrum]
MTLGAVEFPLPPTRQERAVSDGSKNESRYRGRGRALSSGDSTYSHGSWSSADSSETLRRLRRFESGSVALEDQFCGWLWMRGTKFGRWRHRYFCLNGTVLSYFVTFPSEEFLRQASPDVFHFSDGTTPRGVLRVAHVEETISNIGFKVFGTCGRVIDIRAHRVDERNEWLRALKTPARRKSRSWSAGDAEDLTLSLASFDSDMTCTLDRHSIPVVKSGWMLKQSDVLKRWNKYFFVLQGKMLSYYASDKPYEVPRRRGYVQSVNVSRTSVGSNGFYPDLEVKLDGQLGLRMRLNSEDELEEWRMLLLECSTSPDASLYAIL